MHATGRRREPGRRQLGLPLVFIALALVGLVGGALFGTYIIRSLIDATTPRPPSGGISDNTTPPSTPPAGGGTATPTDPGTPGTTQPATIQVRVAGTLYYSAQVAALSTAEPAQTVAREAAGLGLPSYVWEPVTGGDNLYRVRCGITTSRAAVDVLVARVKAAGYTQAFVATIDSASLNITVQAPSGTYLTGFKAAVEGLAVTARACGAAWDSFAESGLSPQALSSHLVPVSSAAAAIRTALAAQTPPAALRERHDVLLGLINMADAAVVELIAVANGGVAGYPRAMSAYMAFVSTFSRVCASWQ